MNTMQRTISLAFVLTFTACGKGQQDHTQARADEPTQALIDRINAEDNKLPPSDTQAPQELTAPVAAADATPENSASLVCDDEQTQDSMSAAACDELAQKSQQQADEKAPQLNSLTSSQTPISAKDRSAASRQKRDGLGHPAPVLVRSFL